MCICNYNINNVCFLYLSELARVGKPPDSPNSYTMKTSYYGDDLVEILL